MISFRIPGLGLGLLRRVLAVHWWRRGISIVVVSASTPRATESLVFVWFLSVNEGHSSDSRVVRPAVAMVVPSKTTSAEAKIRSISLLDPKRLTITVRITMITTIAMTITTVIGTVIIEITEISTAMKDLILKTVAVGNAWRHFLRQANLVYARCLNPFVRLSCQPKDVRFAVVLDAIPEIMTSLLLIAQIVSPDVLFLASENRWIPRS